MTVRWQCDIESRLVRVHCENRLLPEDLQRFIAVVVGDSQHKQCNYLMDLTEVACADIVYIDLMPAIQAFIRGLCDQRCQVALLTTICEQDRFAEFFTAIKDLVEDSEMVDLRTFHLSQEAEDWLCLRQSC